MRGVLACIKMIVMVGVTPVAEIINPPKLRVSKRAMMISLRSGKMFERDISCCEIESEKEMKT